MIELENGNACIPQHYLKYNHNIDTVEAIVADVEFSDNYPVFVCSDATDNSRKTNVYFEVGIIGFDNYCSQARQALQKIIYDCQWWLEPNLSAFAVISFFVIKLFQSLSCQILSLNFIGVKFPAVKGSRLLA
ncbi:hypothetical protein [Kordiimonas sp. SCSIO 12610]|uniref:hypothetical protein n=1 Tax=Kordiimonas sp. SCSIO 12610 TaxID=2829597 RepID=UPI00210C6328|nr:hypothetical protein [Kordiimonas sp. SCSIO 12610]UTW56285.1 hypothetical protein KFF44_05125 [Kordiimonas sp. SCSIO 12610]